jgi:hypothetical protein
MHMPNADAGKDITNDVLICLRRIIQLIDMHPNISSRLSACPFPYRFHHHWWQLP